MRRRFVKETKKSEQINNKPQMKKVEEVKKIEEKPKAIEKKEINKNNKSLTAAYVATNKLPDYTIIGETNNQYKTKQAEEFLRFVFENVLEYDKITVNSEDYQVVPTEGNIYNEVNNCELNGSLIASSVLYYLMDHYCVGLIIDGVRDGENNVISQINIKFKSTEEPSDDTLNQELTWVIDTQCRIYPLIEGAKLQDIVNVLDNTKENYGRHDPINKPDIVHNRSLKSYYPSKKLNTVLPTANMIPTKTTPSTFNNVGGYVTGYFFFYNYDEQITGEFKDQVRAVFTYVSIPLSFNGTSRTISVGDLISCALSSTNENYKHIISVKGNSSNACGFPKSSTCYQNNFGDARGNREVLGNLSILYPKVWWQIYDKQFE